MSGAVTIRPAGSDDVRACGRIFYEAFRDRAEKHNFPPEVPSEDVGIGIIDQPFGNPGFYCVVAVAGARVVGSNCLDERNEISGIGPISVDPGVQDGGIGWKLMARSSSAAISAAFAASAWSRTPTTAARCRSMQSSILLAASSWWS